MRGFTKPKQERYLQHIREGMRRGPASDQVEIDRIKMRDFIAADADFRKKLENAEIDATENVEEALYQAAISGSVPAAKAWIDLKGEKREKPVRAERDVPPADEDDESDAPSQDNPWTELDNVAEFRRPGAS